PDEDGYALWLRYLPVQQVAPLRAVSAAVAAPAATPTQVVARDELRRGLEGLSGRRPAAVDGVPRDGVVVLGTPASSPLVAALDLDLAGIGEEGYLVRSVRIGGRAATVIAANSDIGVLYGVFHFLRLAQTGQPLAALDVTQAPKVKVRVLNHWDNLDRYVERGYAGESIWDWHRLPDWLDPRYTDYARANASIGING